MSCLEDRLKEARSYANMTQPQLSSAVGVSLRTLKAYEKDASSIALRVVRKIALTCNVDEIWLLTGHGSKFKKDEPVNENELNVTKVIIEHQGIVQRFKNPEKGLENNEYLLGIEAASEDLYKKVSDYLKTTHEAATIIMTELKGSKKTPNDGEDIQDKSTA
jgi:transcriptional regulator with XRE-family HTH domain